MNISRSIQGRPVLYTAGSSPTFVDLAPSYTDGAFIGAFSMAQTLHTANALRRKLTEKNRRPEDFLVTTSQNPIMGSTEAEAHRKYHELISLDPYRAIPEPLFIGSAETVADDIQHWYEAGVMDMLLIKQDHPYGLKDFIDLVVPILQDRGIFHTEYEAGTLRGNLGSQKPAFKEI